jgi:hypothetical protein
MTGGVLQVVAKIMTDTKLSVLKYAFVIGPTAKSSDTFLQGHHQSTYTTDSTPKPQQWPRS